MKKGHIVILLLLAGSWCYMVVSCKKQNDAVSQCGNTLVCAKIDSNTFVADSFKIAGEYLGSYANLASYIDTGGNPVNEFSVFAKKFQRDSSLHAELYLYLIADTLNNGTYTTSSSQLTFEYRTGAVGKEQVWQTNDNNQGTLTITKVDTITNIASGTFSFTCTQEHVINPGRKVITNGNFNGIKLFKYKR